MVAQGCHVLYGRLRLSYWSIWHFAKWLERNGNPIGAELLAWQQDQLAMGVAYEDMEETRLGCYSLASLFFEG